MCSYLNLNLFKLNSIFSSKSYQSLFKCSTATCGETAQVYNIQILAIGEGKSKGSQKPSNKEKGEIIRDLNGILGVRAEPKTQ